MELSYTTPSERPTSAWTSWANRIMAGILPRVAAPALPVGHRLARQAAAADTVYQEPHEGAQGGEGAHPHSQTDKDAAGCIHALCRFLHGSQALDQNIFMVNTSNQIAHVSPGIVSIDHPAMLTLMCDPLQQGAGEDMERQRLQHKVIRAQRSAREMDRCNKNMSEKEHKAIYKILAKYTQVFTNNEVKAGFTKCLTMEIRLNVR